MGASGVVIAEPSICMLSPSLESMRDLKAMAYHFGNAVSMQDVLEIYLCVVKSRNIIDISFIKQGYHDVGDKKCVKSYKKKIITV